MESILRDKRMDRRWLLQSVAAGCVLGIGGEADFFNQMLDATKSLDERIEEARQEEAEEQLLLEQAREQRARQASTGNSLFST